MQARTISHQMIIRDLSPIGLLVDENELCVVYEDRLVVINQISKKVMDIIQFENSANIMGVCTDNAGTNYMYNNNMISRLFFKDHPEAFMQLSY